MEIGLVSCTKSKRDQPAKPADLYTESAFFRKAREYVEANHDDWYILSAKHHLLDPFGPPIGPYDDTLSGAPIARKREWAETVFNQLEKEGLLDDGNRLVFHAGRDYYTELIPLLEDTPIDIKTPTDGLQFGKTLAWYNEHI
ncbi:hypothetical protein C463_06677 [Halorubrum californiense DSM 19288]|uniref:DUF6884 domain-containing protein n=1 Tax=Halorubrum californiense DSM 19288 TaxID=1227465 RepID=M0EBY3_9EURY|nr:MULTISPECIES: DUF6884 domain-containing protein [Halorubrum]ELZ45285.1 hypothetical protein C463_06677 [Halorubrum californiense DSM 19288]TKX72137.1 hypothetical protein EXE40_05655 [Halorubrum sp. GN11GM_10-3_MGM]